MELTRYSLDELFHDKAEELWCLWAPELFSEHLARTLEMGEFHGEVRLGRLAVARWSRRACDPHG